MLHTLLEGDEWQQVSASYHSQTILKLDKIKFFACPLKVITPRTWELIRQVNLCTNKDGDVIHLPEPDLSILDQSPCFLAAVETVRRERNSDWYQEQLETWAKQKSHEG